MVSAGTLKNVRVLLVDDHDDGREGLGRLLTYTSAAVLTAGSAEGALTVLAHEVVDVLVTDIDMPDHDGLWLLREIRANDRLRRLPAIAITGRDTSHDPRALITAGFQAHLVKPIDLKALALAIRQLLDERDRRSEWHAARERPAGHGPAPGPAAAHLQ
jgi:two-component system, chemotaxis family, CheB/CheR fusion protein